MTTNGGGRQLLPPPVAAATAASSSSTALAKPDARLALFNSRKQWWNLCFVYGDQTKYYRQLYGKRRQINRIEVEKCPKCGNILDTVENRYKLKFSFLDFLACT